MDPFGLSPEEQARIAAETLRSQQILGGAQRRGARFDNLAAIAPLVNNPQVVESAAAAQQAAASRARPMQLGNMGFMADGQFAANPTYLQERLESRAQQRGLAAARAEEQRLLQQQRLEAQALEAQRNRELRALLAGQSNEARRLLAGIAAGNRTEKEEEKVAAGLDKNVQRLSQNIEKAGAAEFSEALSIALGTLANYEGKDIPGYGRLEGALPNAVLSTDAQTTRANMQQAANILLKARSGAAVTNSEMERFLREVGSGAWMDEETLRRGWANVEKTFGARLNNIVSGFDKQTRDEYVARGGLDFTQAPWRPKKSGDAGKPPSGVPAELWNVMTPEERALWNN